MYVTECDGVHAVAVACGLWAGAWGRELAAAVCTHVAAQVFYTWVEVREAAAKLVRCALPCSIRLQVAPSSQVVEMELD